ncbi:MAG: class I SAM-dependent methyltransferase [Anaerolineales bacterium]
MHINGHTRKELIAEVFDRAAHGYGYLSYFPEFGRRLVALAQVGPGAMALDVAAGRGAVLFPLAERVGAQGQAIGVDLSAEMVAQTAEEVRSRSWPNVTLRQMDAERLDFPAASFDAVLCGFGLFFFPHPEQALAEFWRVLKPGGHLAVSTWGDEDPRWTWYDDLLTKYEAVVSLRTKSFDQPMELRRALKQARFVSLRTTTERADWVLPTLEAWWSAIWSLSGRAGLEKLDATARAAFKAEAFARLQTLQQADGFHETLTAHFARAMKPLTPINSEFNNQ